MPRPEAPTHHQHPTARARHEKGITPADQLSPQQRVAAYKVIENTAVRMLHSSVVGPQALDTSKYKMLRDILAKLDGHGNNYPLSDPELEEVHHALVGIPITDL